MLIQILPADGGKAEDFANNTSSDEQTIRSTIAIAGHEAILLDNKPGQRRSRQAFLVVGDTAYIFTLSPLEPQASPEATTDAERLWDILIPSFRFTAEVPVVTSTLPITNTDGEAETITCQSDEPSQVSYVNEMSAYCFQYPVDFTVGQPDEQLALPISGPSHGETRFDAAYLLIEADPADGRTAEDFANNTSSDEQTIRSTIDIAGYEAILLDNKPGQRRNRQAFLVIGDTAYIFTLSPLEPQASPEATADAERLWDILIPSFRFTAE